MTGLENDKILKLYIDCGFDLEINANDFIITIGKNKSNSVYHILESRKAERTNGVRFYLKVFRSDLITCLKRESSQKLIPMVWYNRNKKQ